MGGLRRPFRPWIAVAFFSALVAFVSSDPAFSQSRVRSGAPLPNKPELGSAGERLNANTIAIVSGNLNATYLSIAYDLSAVLDDGDEFRVLPVVGKGGGQNIKDVRFLKGVDLGITQSVLLNGYRKSNEIGLIDDKIVYLAKLFNEEMHLIVRAESGITSIDQLAGRKVNFSDIGSGTQLSSRDIFDKLRHQGPGSECRPGRRVREAEVGRDRGDDPDRGQAGGVDGAAGVRRRLPHPAGAVPQGAAGRLSAGDAGIDRLSAADRAGQAGGVRSRSARC